MGNANRIIAAAALGSMALFCSCSTVPLSDYQTRVDEGRFAETRIAIQEQLNRENSLSDEEQALLLFELERMDRIEIDFTVTEEALKTYLKEYIPDLDDTRFHQWESAGSLEYMVLDEQKLYFKWAGRNLFRMDEECKKIWAAHHAGAEEDKALDLTAHAREIIAAAREAGTPFVNPRTFRIRYSITVHADAVPFGETIRCWIPFPRDLPGKQNGITLIRSEPAEYRLADNQALQRTLYLEKPAREGEPTVFAAEYGFTSHGVYVDLNPEEVVRTDPDEKLETFLQEEPPHIVFTEELRELSKRIVGKETNPYRIAWKLFAWIDAHVPWTSAREYSTIRNLSQYGARNRHGDCGIKTMLFITLCRMNHIPARWQSGWRFQPPRDTMHDWGMIHFAPYGWMPMDITRGVLPDPDESVQRFYLNGMDSYRLIFNDDFSQPLEPGKEHFRSDTVDSQRGEVEWRGGNLYFDQWDWDMEWEVEEGVE